MAIFCYYSKYLKKAWIKCAKKAWFWINLDQKKVFQADLKELFNEENNENV